MQKRRALWFYITGLLVLMDLGSLGFLLLDEGAWHFSQWLESRWTMSAYSALWFAGLVLAAAGYFPKSYLRHDQTSSVGSFARFMERWGQSITISALVFEISWRLVYPWMHQVLPGIFMWQQFLSDPLLWLLKGLVFVWFVIFTLWQRWIYQISQGRYWLEPARARFVTIYRSGGALASMAYVLGLWLLVFGL